LKPAIYCALPYGSQNPQCEGYHKDRIFFNAKIPGADRFFFIVKQQDNKYTLQAGVAQGITKESEFAIYADHIVDPKSNPSLCTLRVKSTDVFSSTLEPLDGATPCQLPKPVYARQVRCGPGVELHVHFTEALTRLVTVDDIQHAAVKANEADIGFVLDGADKAEVLVDVVDRANSPRVVFTMTYAREHSFELLPHDVPAKPESISHVLCWMARWNYHVKRASQNRLSGTVHLEFTRLEHFNEEYDGEGMPVMRTVGEDMNRTGVVEMVVNPEHFFGVKIINNTKGDLYPYLFYFDVSDQSIGEQFGRHFRFIF